MSPDVKAINVFNYTILLEDHIISKLLFQGFVWIQAPNLDAYLKKVSNSY